MTDRMMTMLLRGACLLTLLALLLMVWSVILPGPLSVVIAMSAGQGIGTFAFGLYLFTILADLRRSGVLGERRSERQK
jgi:hypothetical protein